MCFLLLYRLQGISNAEAFLRVALKNVGKDLSPTQDELGCAECVNTIHKLAFGDDLGCGASTYVLWRTLLFRKDFKEVSEYENGAIIISPTGTSTIGSEHGHCGIIVGGRIISNNSNTGRLDTHWDEPSWRAYFGIKLGFPIFFFKKL